MLARNTVAAVAATAVIALGLGVAPPAMADSRDQDDRRSTSQKHAERHLRGEAFSLSGDPEGSRFEGIATDQRRGVFYVSEVTGGEIHRGQARHDQTTEWLAAGVDGRNTARGMTVDNRGRLFIAGGPNGLGTGLPDVWVYSPDGTLLASMRMPASDVFVNDVTIGRDGAAYFTDSNNARIYRVAPDRKGAWRATVWADATSTIPRADGFNLGGIVQTADRSGFVVAQGNVGKLWRFGYDGSVQEVTVAGANLVNADGLVLQGRRLTVVQNFSRTISTVRLSADGRSARLIDQRPTSPSRVLTTAAVLRGELLFVDSEFGPNPATPPYEVVTNPYS